VVSAPLAPRGLGPAGQKFWRAIVADFDLAGAHERVLLEQACRELDLIARLDEALEGAPLEVDTRAHGLVANRLLAEVQSHRGTLRMLLRDLRLPAEPAEPGTVLRLSPAQARAHRVRRSHRRAVS
jgi:hypothetical protein